MIATKRIHYFRKSRLFLVILYCITCNIEIHLPHVFLFFPSRVGENLFLLRTRFSLYSGHCTTSPLAELLSFFVFDSNLSNLVYHETLTISRASPE